LKLALHFPHKHIVYHNIVCRLFQFIFDADQLEFAFHGFALVKQIHGFEESYETALAAFEPGSHQVADLEHHQIYVV